MWWSADHQGHAARVRARARHRLRHQLLRHARHRLVRADDGDRSSSSRWCPDRLIPGTLNVGHTLPTIAQAFIYTAVDRRRPDDADSDDRRGRRRRLARRRRRRELAEAQRADRHGLARCSSPRPCSRGAICRGGYLSGRRHARHGRRGTGTLDLEGTKLVVGLVGNFVLGALMTLGIGMYAPCMILVGLLGMNAQGGVPDHDGLVRVPDAGEQRAVREEGRLLAAPGAGARHRRHARRAHRRVHRQGHGRSMYVRWLVVGVVLIAATMMLRSAAKNE